MSDSNCICFRCKQPLIEMNSYGQLLWGCVNCKLWWLARNPVRSHCRRSTLNLNQTSAGTPDVYHWLNPGRQVQVGYSAQSSIMTAAISTHSLLREPGGVRHRGRVSRLKRSPGRLG